MSSSRDSESETSSRINLEKNGDSPEIVEGVNFPGSTNVASSDTDEIKQAENIADSRTLQCSSSKPVSNQQGNISLSEFGNANTGDGPNVSTETIKQTDAINAAKILRQTIEIASREINTVKIPSGTDILALACEAVASELAASKTTTTFGSLTTEMEASNQTVINYPINTSNQSASESVKPHSPSGKYFVENVGDYEPNVMAELGESEVTSTYQTTKLTSEALKDQNNEEFGDKQVKATTTSGKTNRNKTPSKDLLVHQTILTRASAKSLVGKTHSSATKENMEDEIEETDSPPLKKKKTSESSEPEHSYSLGRIDKKTNIGAALESDYSKISSPTNETIAQTIESQGKLPNNVMTGITSKPVNPDEKPVTITSPDELYTVELTTVSTIGGVMKPLTVTVLNVAGMMFKCGKCSKPFEKQLPARTLSYFKYHNCQKEKVDISKTPPQKGSPSSPVAHSASQTPVTSNVPVKRPVGRPPKQHRGRGRPRKIPVADVDQKETGKPTEHGHADGDEESTKTPSKSPVKKKIINEETSTDVQEDKAETEDKHEDEDLEEGEVETLYSRTQQIQFIKDHYRKSQRRSSRLVKIGVKDLSEVKIDADLKDDGDNDFQDDGELDDPSDPDFVKESEVKATQSGDGNTADNVNQDKKDFCIKCYLKLEHKCQVKVKVANRHKTKTCHICNKTYKTVNSLNQHMRAHTGERPYVCSICSKAFRRSSTLFEHMQIHNGVKKFLCAVCGKKFLRKSDHTAHMRIHSNDFNFRCDVCGKGFKGNSQLEVHMRKHTGEMPFLCTVCGHKFKHPFGLQVHMKFHEMSENPLRCTECDTVYEDPDELRMHDCPQGKQHMCSVCGKTFANHFAVKGHMKIHLRDNPSLCKSCQETFPNEQALQIHQDENIVKCSDCAKTIKEARACMLNKLPGNSLKGKKFKCWQCHSAQCAAREQAKGSQPDISMGNEPDSKSELEQQHNQGTQVEDSDENYTEVHIEHHIQIHHPDVVQSDISHFHQSQQEDGELDQSAAKDIGQSVQVYHAGQPVTLHVDQSNQGTQGAQSIISRMLHPTTVEVYTTTPSLQEGTHQIVVADQLGEAIQSIETTSGDHTFYETQTVFSDMIPPVQAQETVHYTTQVQQQQQPVHHIQQYQNDTGQQQHTQTVYQMQPMTQQHSLLHPHQRLHQM